MAKKWFIFATLSIVAIILATAGYYNLYYKKTVRQNQESHNTSTRIASIGSENIYQSNLDLYKQEYSRESEDQLWQRLKHDSARLQYGATLGILNLDPTFYNSATWELPKRLDHVNKVTVAQQAKKKYTYTVLTVYFNSAKTYQGEELQKQQSRAGDLLNKLSESTVGFKRQNGSTNLIEDAKKLDSRNGESPLETKYLDQILPDPAFSNIYTPSVLSTTESQKWSDAFTIYDGEIPVALAKTYTLNQSDLSTDQSTANNFPKYLEEIIVQRFDIE